MNRKFNEYKGYKNCYKLYTKQFLMDYGLDGFFSASPAPEMTLSGIVLSFGMFLKIGKEISWKSSSHKAE